MSSIWTTTDRDNVKAAILALATGARSVTLNDKSVTRESLSQLKALLKEIDADLKLHDTASGGFTNKVTFARPV